MTKKTQPITATLDKLSALCDTFADEIKAEETVAAMPGTKTVFTLYGWSVVEDTDAGKRALVFDSEGGMSEVINDDDRWLILDNDGDVFDTSDQRCDAIGRCRDKATEYRLEFLWDAITSVDPYDHGIARLEKIAKSLNLNV